STANTPTRIDACAPTSSCDATSRPRLSVPNQCAALDPCSLLGMSSSAGGYGDQTIATSAASSSSADSSAPIAKLGWRSARAAKPLRSAAALVAMVLMALAGLPALCAAG